MVGEAVQRPLQSVAVSHGMRNSEAREETELTSGRAPSAHKGPDIQQATGMINLWVCDAQM